MDAGMNVARFNFSHGSQEGHYEVLERLRNVAESKCRNIGKLRLVRCAVCYILASTACRIVDLELIVDTILLKFCLRQDLLSIYFILPLHSCSVGYQRAGNPVGFL